MFLDPELHKIKLNDIENGSQNLLYSVILTRYFPAFIKFLKKDSNISRKTIDDAIKINKIKPFILKNFDYINGPELIKNDYFNSNKFSLQNVQDYLVDAFKSHSFKRDFEKFFSEDFYFRLLYSIENDNKNSLELIFYSFQLLKIIDDTNNFYSLNFSEWIFNLIKRNHFHTVNDVYELNNKLCVKSDINHIHNFLSKNQVEKLQEIIKNGIYKKICFDIDNEIIHLNTSLNIFNLKILDFEDNLINVDFDELYVIFDNQFKIPFNNVSFKTIDDVDYYYIPTCDLNWGEHEICFKYKDTYSEDMKFFIINESNEFNVDEWLSLDINYFDKFNVDSISSSFDWADLSNKSIKVICNGENNYQALVTKKHNVRSGDLISAYVTIFNPEGEVVVRLFESSARSYNDVIVPPSKTPKRINIFRKVLKDNVQLLLISRVKQTFYADNFILTIN